MRAPVGPKYYIFNSLGPLVGPKCCIDFNYFLYRFQWFYIDFNRFCSNVNLLHRFQLFCIDFTGFVWIWMDSNRFQWISMEKFLGATWGRIQELWQWISIDFHGFAWISIDFNGFTKSKRPSCACNRFQWICIAFNGFCLDSNGFSIDINGFCTDSNGICNSWGPRLVPSITFSIV